MWKWGVRPLHYVFSSMRSRTRRVVVSLVIVAVAALFCVGLAWLRVLFNSAEPSRVSGKPAHGSIAHAKSIPPSGDGFVTYSYLGSALGRQYVHGAVLSTLRDAFASAAAKQP